MLTELLTSLLTRTAPVAGGFGYAHEIAAIEARHRRWGNSWAGHLGAGKALIAEATALSDRQRCVVLGSGPGLEFSLDRLCDHFAEVVLVDMAHPPRLRWAVRRRNRSGAGQVRLVRADVTGMARPIRDWSGSTDIHLPETATAPFSGAGGIAEGGASLWISCNLISQLAPFLLAYADRHRPGAISDAERERFARAVIDAHIAGLKSVSGTVCLIAETERIYRDRAGRVIEREDALAGAGLPKAAQQRSWTWHSAPPGEIDRRFGMERAMTGLIWRSAEQCAGSGREERPTF